MAHVGVLSGRAVFERECRVGMGVADNGQLYIRYLKENDEEAFRCLFESYSDGLTLFLYGIVGDMEDAKELMMDTFAVLSSKTAGYTPRKNSSFKTWLFTIAKNLAFKFLRKKKRLNLISRDPGADQTEDIPADPALDPENRYFCEQEKRELYRALSTLPADYRDVLYLSFFEGLKAEEICRVMRKTKKQVYHLMERGKAALKKELERTETGESSS